MAPAVPLFPLPSGLASCRLQTGRPFDIQNLSLAINAVAATGAWHAALRSYPPHSVPGNTHAHVVPIGVLICGDKESPGGRVAVVGEGR